MKVTARQFRRIVKAEINLLREAGETSDAAAAGKGNKVDTQGTLNTKEIAAQLKIDEPTLKVALTAAKKDDPSKGKALLAFVKALLAAGPDESKKVGQLFAKISSKGE